MKIKMQNVILDTIEDLNYLILNDCKREKTYSRFKGQLQMYRAVTEEHTIFRTSDAGFIISIKFGEEEYITWNEEEAQYES